MPLNAIDETESNLSDSSESIDGDSGSESDELITVKKSEMNSLEMKIKDI